MKDWSPFVAVFALTVPLSSCTPSIPTAPDLSPVLQAYAMPTAVVDGEIMGEVADEIAANAEAIENSEIFEEILNAIIDIQQELEDAIATTCNGGDNNGNACTDDADCPGGTCRSDLVVGGACSGGTNDGGECTEDADCPDGTCAGGVTLPSPTGAINMNYICPGWDERQFEDGYDDSPDRANGSIDLTMTLDSGGIGRVVWGTAAQCMYLLPNEGDDCEAAGCSEASYDGGIALDLGDDWVTEDIAQLEVTFVLEGTIGFDDEEPFRINQSFRVTLADESGLTLLVDLADPALSETFNYIFADTFQCIRDATPPSDPQSPCSFGCSLEESRCFDESGTLFSW